MEIERKFIIGTIEFDLTKFDCKEVHQAYLQFEPEIRIRKIGDDFVKTDKSSGNRNREEFEHPISKQDYNHLLSMAISNIIHKKRYYIPLDGGFMAELDIYEGRLLGLKTVEVEFTCDIDADRFIPPAWFGTEVTDDKNYKNKNLSKLDRWHND